VLVDANLLLFARNADDPHHQAARRWLTEALNGPTRVGLPWQSLTAFVRIATNPRAFPAPLDPATAWDQVEAWLAAPAAWVPHETHRHGDVLGDLVRRHQVRGPLVSDAQLAALGLEHGIAVASADSDFARFPEVRWINPLER
jgi:toxin-antitoxin system PIN domain toxin